MATSMAAKTNELIHISVTDQGNMVYSAATYHDARGNTICWTGQGPFAIQFSGISPLEKAEGRSQGGEQHPLCLKVRMDAQPGVYSYACAVYVNGRVYLDASCPAIIID